MSEFCPKCKAVHAPGLACDSDDLAAPEGAPMTRKDLDPDQPTASFVANIHPPCHKGRPLRAKYAGGVLVLECAKCGALAAHFKIAAE